jgi:uncharacterized protein YndB with AHSA1/START domain
VSSDPRRPEATAPGEVTLEGDRARLVFRRRFHHPPERVWSAITDPEQLRTWMLTEARIDGRPGGSVDLVTGPDRVHATGRILEWAPPRVCEYEWNVPPGPRLPNGEAAVVRWELTPDPEGTLLVLTHRHLSRPTASVFARGQRGFLDRLSAQLDGRAMPDWPPAPQGGEAGRP